MREGHRNEMFSSMIADVIESNPDFRFELERAQQPEQQEQRIWELDSDEEDPTEEEKEKKRAKNKKKYLRKKEKQQAEKGKREEEKCEDDHGVEQGLVGLAIKDITPVLTKDRESGSSNSNTASAATPTQQPKLSKRQKKTLLKKAKQAQNKTSSPELAGSSTTGESASISKDTKFRFVDHDERKKKNKVHDRGHEESEPEDEKEAATESEFEAVMDTVAKRFGQ